MKLYLSPAACSLVPHIVQYIADQARTTTTLVPAAGSIGRYRVMEWQNYITSALQRATRRCSTPKPRERCRFIAAGANLFVVTGWAKFVDLDLCRACRTLNPHRRQTPVTRAATACASLEIRVGTWLPIKYRRYSRPSRE